MDLLNAKTTTPYIANASYCSLYLKAFNIKFKFDYDDDHFYLHLYFYLSIIKNILLNLI